MVNALHIIPPTSFFYQKFPRFHFFHIYQFKNGQVIWNRSKIVTEIRQLQKLLHSSPGSRYRITTYNTVSRAGSCPVTRVLHNGFSTISLRTELLNPILSVRTFFTYILSRFSLTFTFQHSIPLLVALFSLPG